MKDDEALRKVLRDLTIALSEDNELRDVEFLRDDKLGTAPTSGTIRVNPEPARVLEAEERLNEEQEFALLVNTESHELEHDVVSDLNSKEEFAKAHPDRKRLAGFVINVVEDVYIDKRRTDRDRGLRPIQALFSDVMMDKNKPIHEYNGITKYANAVLHIGKGGGTPKEMHKVDDEDFRNYCAELRALIDEARNTHTPQGRWELSADILSLIESYCGKRDAPNLEMPQGATMDAGDSSSGSGDTLPEPSEESEGEEDDDEGQGMDMDGMSGGDGESEEGESNGEEDGESAGDGGSGESEEGEQNGDQSGSGSSERVTECPECGYDSPNGVVQDVDGMVAARVNAPFNVNAAWVADIEFVAHADDDGVCGFRVNPQGDVPTDKIESKGYKVVDVNGSIEILEPKGRYDDTEEVKGYECPKCGHDWIPTIGSQ